MGRAQRIVKGSDTTRYEALIGASPYQNNGYRSSYTWPSPYKVQHQERSVAKLQTLGGYEGVSECSQTVTSVSCWGVAVDNKGIGVSVGAGRTREISAFRSVLP